MTRQLARALRPLRTPADVTGLAGLARQPPGRMTENVTWSRGSRLLLARVADTVVVLAGATRAGAAAAVSDP